MLRNVLVWGILLAVVIILGRVILGSTRMSQEEGATEHFASGVVASLGKGRGTTEHFASLGKGRGTTEHFAANMCPSGSTREIYDGVAYCCSNPKPGASTLKNWCKALPHKEHVFCTLGAETHGIPNCKEFKDKIRKTKGAALCPKTMPHYMDDKCCTDPGCKDSCKIVDNYFKDDTSCQFLKAKEEPCPADYDAMTKKGKDGFHLYGCINKEVCYSAAILTRLKEMNYDTTGMTSC
jgi:hypothetical protein